MAKTKALSWVPPRRPQPVHPRTRGIWVLQIAGSVGARWGPHWFLKTSKSCLSSPGCHSRPGQGDPGQGHMHMGY